MPKGVRIGNIEMRGAQMAASQGKIAWKPPLEMGETGFAHGHPIPLPIQHGHAPA